MKTQGDKEPVGRSSGRGAQGEGAWTETLGGASGTEEGEDHWRKVGMGWG